MGDDGGSGGDDGEDDGADDGGSGGDDGGDDGADDGGSGGDDGGDDGADDGGDDGADDGYIYEEPDAPPSEYYGALVEMMEEMMAPMMVIFMRSQTHLHLRILNLLSTTMMKTIICKRADLFVVKISFVYFETRYYRRFVELIF